MSTGMASCDEINDAVINAKENGCDELLLFHCISSYPTPVEESRLNNLIYLRDKFNLEIGLSDHTIGNATAIASVALGASIIEKHVTLDRNGGGPDDSFSLESEELIQLCVWAKTAWESIGQVDYGRKSSEQANVKFRRSLYFVKDIKEGEVITSEHVKSIRPGYGLAPKFYEQILGKTVKLDVVRGTPVTEAMYGI